MKRAPILLVHGAFCGAWVWDRFAGPLRAAGHVVIAPDLPGHGPDAPADAAIGLSMNDYAAAIPAAAAATTAPA